MSLPFGMQRIAIAGAGIGGLSFALSLRTWCTKRALPVPQITIFERDAHRHARMDQGYTLSIRNDTGGAQTANRMGIYQQLLKDCTQGSSFLMRSADGGVLCKFTAPVDASGVASIRVARNYLRQTLLDAVLCEGAFASSASSSASSSAGSSACAIRWATPASGAELQPNGVKLLLANGSTYDADLLVVADGSKSRVRQHVLPDEKLHFTGIAILAGQSRLPVMPPQLHRQNNLYMGRGSCTFMAAASDHDVVFGLGIPCKEPHVEMKYGDAHYSRDAIMKEATQLGAQFGEPFASVLMHAEDKHLQIFNGYDKEPHGSTGRIAFIGDSSHAVTPFSGNGANMAIVDAWNLADQLTLTSAAGAHPTIEAALKAFDKEMIPRTRATVMMGRRTIASSTATSTCAIAQRNTIFRVLHVLMNYPRATRIVAALFVVALIVLIVSCIL